MAFLHVKQPSGTGFFVFPVDEENVQSRVPHDFTRTYSLASLESLIDLKTISQLKTRLGSGRLSVVGLWPDDDVTKKWQLIIGGETCLFVTRTALVASGTVIYSKRSRQLADAVFGKGAQGMYELLILLVGVEPFQFTLQQFYEAIGRKSRSPYKTFTTLSTQNIHKIEERFGSIYSFFEAARARPQPANAKDAPGPAG